MRGLYIAAAVLAVLLLLSRLRVGGGAEYNATGFRAWVRVARWNIQVFPTPEKKAAKPKKKAPKKKKEPAQPKEEQSPALPLGGALDYVQEFLPIGLEALGGFAQRLQVDQLYLRLTVGAPDPADAAMAYGQATAALGAVWTPLTQALHVKDGRAKTVVDFEADSMTLYGKAALSMGLGQLLALGLSIGIKALRAFFSVRGKHKTLNKQRKAA